MSAVRVRLCGEEFIATERQPLLIGREADISVDDNRYLHRRFLQVACVEGLWVLRNVGAQLTATVSDLQGLFQAWLAPGAQVPLLSTHTIVYFTAGPTTYEIDILLDEPPFTVTPVISDPDSSDGGPVTMGGMSLTTKQKLVLLALTERALRRGDRGATSIPSSKVAAQRLRWTLVAFNRQLDNICQKLAAFGVRGLHGDSENLAANRRARLAEYALAARLVTRADLALLEGVEADGEELA
ncbi:hypothetical protein Rhe02_75070 [Rhizocola hellebori]|uniref:FHA domain-containing protein n=1 Tax=Rhizocola hellebori TaxID=1392758 RepID=A0A8J3QGS3_9ACTN|nr:hypothetical protein [Rhizocola hellebori]GIH09440.1 hypothetical protein Rhe02_75070 [Rhizocola hellebori]